MSKAWLINSLRHEIDSNERQYIQLLKQANGKKDEISDDRRTLAVAYLDARNVFEAILTQQGVAK